MGSRMPDSPIIPRMDRTLHQFLQKIIDKSKKPTSQQVLRKNMDVCQKVQRSKLPHWQNLSIPMLVLQFSIDKIIKIEGLGKNGGSIMHPYF